jgi:hypothetical protein
MGTFQASSVPNPVVTSTNEIAVVDCPIPSGILGKNGKIQVSEAVNFTTTTTGATNAGDLVKTRLDCAVDLSAAGPCNIPIAIGTMKQPTTLSKVMTAGTVVPVDNPVLFAYANLDFIIQNRGTYNNQWASPAALIGQAPNVPLTSIGADTSKATDLLLTLSATTTTSGNTVAITFYSVSVIPQ